MNILLKQLDEIDIGIIELLESNSDFTHNEIAQQMNRSQPAIGARIKKLQELGFLSHLYGIDFKNTTDLKLVKVEMAASNPDDILKLAKTDPHVINAFKVSGMLNIFVLMACSSLKRLDFLVDQYFRRDPSIQKVKMEMITDMANEFVLPVKFIVEDFKSYRSPIDVTDLSGDSGKSAL